MDKERNCMENIKQERKAGSPRFRKPSSRDRDKLFSILEYSPHLKEIIRSSVDLEEKRKRLRYFLSDTLFMTFEDQPAIPPLEWILTRNAVGVFKNMISRRNERLAGFSILSYISDLAGQDTQKGLPHPSPGFFRELEALVRGISGKTGIYSDKVPGFLKKEGRNAAKLRSKDLSKMAGAATLFMNRYPCGLDEEVVRTRSMNKSKILAHFSATDYEWNDWQWHTRNIIRNADQLAALVSLKKDEYKAVQLARENRIPFGITPYYLSLMDNESNGDDDAVRAQVIPPLSYIHKMASHKMNRDASMDFMLEKDTSPVDGITRRYPMIVIIKPVLTCPQICVYCQRNWEIEDVYSEHAIAGKSAMEKAVQWIRDTPEISEVLITGGDPFILSDERIEELLTKIAQIPHVERIRIGSRTPVTLPFRITEELVRKISQFHIPGKREILLVTHFEHPYEITPESMEAVQKFRRFGMQVYNQLVYTFFNSRKFEAAFLRHKLRLIGVSPYYTFNTKGKEETDEYRVPIARLLQEQDEEARMMPGTVRTDEIVFNVPKLGKNYLRAIQHHDLISILPDGRRVYEFHPWEKKLSLMDTYVYTDVSIHEYLMRLKNRGEDIAPYKTIWYYY